MEPLKKIPIEIFQKYKAIAGYQQDGNINIAMLMFEENNELISKVCDNLQSNIEFEFGLGVGYESPHTVTGPEYFTKICKSYINNEDYLFLNSKYLYPYWYNEYHRKSELFKETSPESYAVHHWNHSWNPANY